VTTRTIDVQEAQSQLHKLLPLVASGTEIIITEGSTPVARLVPIEAPAATRKAGLHAGVAWMSADFDAPLPEAFWTQGE
jgi:prevent-host-death family protein